MFITRLRAMMPQDSLQLALTAGFGFSVLAGIFSGVVYIISVGYNKTKRFGKRNTPWHCAFCGTQFHSINGVLEPDDVATCVKCARTFCKEKCATRSKPSIAHRSEEVLPSERSCVNDDSRRPSYSAAERWICKKCQPDSWITGIVRLLQFNEKWHTTKMAVDQAQIHAELDTLQRKEREQVRDFIERLVEALLGGELDNVSVKKIYKDARYDAIFARYHGDLSSALTDLGSALHITISSKWYLPIAGESPCAAHASLKTLIQRFIREAYELPELRKADAQQEDTHPAIPDDNNDRTYEDLLSTAIINKVVQNYQEKPPSTARSSSGKSTRSTSDKEYFLGERNLDSSSKYDDSSSLSSLDDYINTNGSTKYLDQMNYAIQQSIKEVSSSDEEDANYDMDDVGMPSLRNSDWQENWYLRKRNFAPGNSPVPVPMLVPNPNASEHAKVLIGDCEIDDTSDLSNAASDCEDSAEPSSLNAFLINSKNLIGGQNPLMSIVAQAESVAVSADAHDRDNDAGEEHLPKTVVQQPADTENGVELVEFASIDTGHSGDKDDEESSITEACNVTFIRDPHHLDLGACGDVEDQLISLESNTEQDSEYTEKYATLPRKIPMPKPRQSTLVDIDFSKTSLLIEDSKTDNGDSGVTSDEDDKQKTFKNSSYGEREKDKWNHAVDLPNNPYSKSNLENRLSNRSNCSASISNQNSVPYLHATEVRKVQNSVESAAPDTEIVPPPLPKTPLPEMSKSLFDVLNEDRRDYIHRYGRDYFAKAAGRPQGAMKKNWVDDDDESRDGDAADDEERKVGLVDYPIVPQENIFRATPAVIQLDESGHSMNQNDGLSPTEFATFTKRVQLWDLSSESDYSIERTYNVNSGKIIKRLGDVEYEVPVSDKPSAEGLKNMKLDEHQITTASTTPEGKEVQKKRSTFLKALTLENEDLVAVTTPAANHFKLVNEIANESVEQYRVEPISPPAEYRNHEVVDKLTSIEYESEEKSYDFSIESTFEEEERLKQAQQLRAKDNAQQEIIEESFSSGIRQPSHLNGVDSTNRTSPDMSSHENVEDYSQIKAEAFPEPEIEELKEKQLVKNTLGTLVKSYPNLSNTKHNQNQSSITETDLLSLNSELVTNIIEIKGPSSESGYTVWNLKQKFEKDSDTKKEVEVHSSLTARSVPKQMRQQLAEGKHPGVDKPRKHRLNSEVSSETLAINDVNTPVRTKHEEPEAKVISFPKAKSRIAFFEQMSKQ